MRKLFRLAVFGAAVAWGAKALERTRQDWSTRPAAEIRHKVTSKLPASVDPETREKIADKVIEKVKGPQPVAVDTNPPTAQHMYSPPPPEPEVDPTSEDQSD
jgi:hypothetical protein